MYRWKETSYFGHVRYHALTYRPFTAEVLGLSQGSLSDIRSGESGTVRVLVFPCQYHSTNMIYIFNRSWVDTRWQQYITHLHTKQYTQYSSTSHIYT
jgi:hypothetical protein